MDGKGTGATVKNKYSSARMTLVPGARVEGDVRSSQRAGDSQEGKTRSIQDSQERHGGI